MLEMVRRAKGRCLNFLAIINTIREKGRWIPDNQTVSDCWLTE